MSAYGEDDGGSDDLRGDEQTSTRSIPHGPIVRMNDGGESTHRCLLSPFSSRPAELILPRSTMGANLTEAIGTHGGRDQQRLEQTHPHCPLGEVSASGAEVEQETFGQFSHPR